jgi:addiction module HigA family antidote
MNDIPDPNPQDETDQPGQQPATAAPEIYTEERIQEFLAEDALTPVHPGEILKEEFLNPHELTAADLAERLRTPAQSVQSLARSQRPITADDALRLARYFNTTPEFWLNLQAQHDLEVTRERISHELAAITPHPGNSDT